MVPGLHGCPGLGAGGQPAGTRLGHAAQEGSGGDLRPRIQVATPGPPSESVSVGGGWGWGGRRGLRRPPPYIINSPRREGCQGPGEPRHPVEGGSEHNVPARTTRLSTREKCQCCRQFTRPRRAARQRIARSPARPSCRRPLGRAYLPVAMTGWLRPNRRRGGNSYKISRAIVGLTRRDSGSQNQIHWPSR